MLDWLFGRKKEEEEAPKKKKSEGLERWKYDFVVQFLSGPLWKSSILDYVDYHCVVFDTEEENKFEYTKIHNEFKQMVGTLFDDMVQEVGLDDDQLAQILEKGFESSKHKKIFNQLLLVDDFLAFKRLMVSRNKALEAQAMKSMGQEPEPQPAAHKPHKHHGSPSSSEDALLRESMQMEEARRRKMEQEEEAMIKKVMEASRLEAEEQAMMSRLESKAAEKQKAQQPPEPVPEPKIQPPAVVEAPKADTITQSQAVEPETAPVQKTELAQSQAPLKSSKVGQLDPLPPVRSRRRKQQESPVKEEVKEEAKPEEASPAVEEKKDVPEPPPPAPAPEPPQPEAPEETVEDRRRRLKEQREKLRKMKEESRKKQLAEEESKPPVQTIVLQDDGIHETQLGVGPAEEDKKVSNEEIERRKALMKRIKNRIVDDF